MKQLLAKLSLGIVALIILMPFSQISYAETTEELQNNAICAVYVTGIGCPHCAKVDPVIFGKKLQENKNLVVIEYEIYQQQRQNSQIPLNLNDQYGTGFGIPLLIFDKDRSLQGDSPILDNIDAELAKGATLCSLPDGQVSIKDLDITDLPYSPKIWRDERVLLANGKDGNNNVLKDLLFREDIRSGLTNLNYKIIEPAPVEYSDGSVSFENAIEIGGWILEWNDDKEPLSPNGNTLGNGNNSGDGNGTENNGKGLTLTKLISLALADAVNPCEFAVLVLVLISIFTYNPDNKRKILLAGLAFATSIFLVYLVYGLVIIQFFKLIQAITTVKPILYKIFGVIALVLGILNIKDAFWYKAGGFATEMPNSLRPRVHRLIEKVTSPRGAFFVGLFVTVFLLPCTVGPYVIAGGILSTYDFVKTIPPLLLYNFIFVLPMLIITAVVYFGSAKIENVAEWRGKNIKYLHLVAGLIMVGLGISIYMGWV